MFAAVRFRSRLLAISLAVFLAGCASPAARIDAWAAAAGFARSVVAGTTYDHVVYHNRRTGSTLHVYIENDGEPWAGRYAVAGDPTPTRPLMLQLMAADAQPSVYLGRPCYLGFSTTPPCTPLAWTHERYAPAVVDSMAAALQRVVATHQPGKLVFLGHSGGGTLAVLLAERFKQSVAVVTLAGNLDVQAWSQLHGFTPLRGSLDPARQTVFAPGIIQMHYVGTMDRNVPPELLRRFVERRPRAVLIEVDGFDHQCCWRDAWPAILEELRLRLAR